MDYFRREKTIYTENFSSIDQKIKKFSKTGLAPFSGSQRGNKKCDILSFPNHKYKLVADIISTLLAHLFNSSILLGVFFPTLKIFCLTPIFKKDDYSLSKRLKPK